jgi:hypothetical protein
MKKRNLLLAGILGLALVVQPFAVMAEGEEPLQKKPMQKSRIPKAQILKQSPIPLKDLEFLSIFRKNL